MRYAIVSDIHANLQAWKAVLIDIGSLRVDRILCLGDVVGYGPNPVETLRSVHAGVHDFVLGNHDAALCGIIDEALFNDDARRALVWTRRHLNRQATRFFRSLPLSLTGPGFRCAHGDFADPARFDYVVEPEDALRSWNAVPEPLLLVGHTHRPGIFVIGRSGRPHHLPPQDFVIESGKRFLVNVGSVGQSRDGDVRACYLVYDTRDRAIFWRRIPFDLDAFAAALDQAGLRESAARFLASDPRRNQPPLREILDFQPPGEEAGGARDVVAVRDIQAWRYRAGLWRRRCIWLGAATLAGGAAAAGLLWQYNHLTRVDHGPPIAPVNAIERQEGINLLPPLTSGVERRHPPAGWTCRLGNRLRQAAIFPREGPPDAQAPVVLQSTDARASVSLIAAPIGVASGQRFQLRALIRKGTDFEGTIAVVIGIEKSAAYQGERIPRFRVQEPTLRRSGGWDLAQLSFDMPAGAETLTYAIDGLFTGRVEIREVELIRR